METFIFTTDHLKKKKRKKKKKGKKEKKKKLRTEDVLRRAG